MNSRRLAKEIEYASELNENNQMNEELMKKIDEIKKIKVEAITSKDQKRLVDFYFDRSLDGRKKDFLKEIMNNNQDVDLEYLAIFLFGQLQEMVTKNVYVIDKYILLKNWDNDTRLINSKNFSLDDIAISSELSSDISVMMIKYLDNDSDINGKLYIINYLLNRINEILSNSLYGELSIDKDMIVKNSNVNVFLSKSLYEICDMVKNNGNDNLELIIEKDGIVKLYNVNYINGEFIINLSDKEANILYEEKTKKEKNKRLSKKIEKM